MREKETTIKEPGTLRPSLRGQRGALLMETTLVLAVFSLLGIAVLGAVQTSYIGKNQFEIQSTAENLVRNQLEKTYDDPYSAPPYDYTTVPVPAGYSVTAEASVYDVTSTDIQTVRITVYHEGQAVKVFETIRANR